MNFRATRLLVLSLFGGLGAMYGTTKLQPRNQDQPGVEMQDVVVAARDLKIEEVIKPDLTRVVRMPKDAVPNGSYSHVKDVEDRSVKFRMLEGEPIVDMRLARRGVPPGLLVSQIPKGMRAFAIDVNQFVLPGKRVDVTQVVPTSDGTMRVEELLRDVLVLATGQDYKRPNDPSVKWRSVTFAVTTDQADVLIAARGRDPWSLRVRGHDVTRGEERVAGADGEFVAKRNDVKGRAVDQGQPKAGAEATNGKPMASPEKDLTTEEVVARSEASVAVVRGKSSIGSGFLVKPGVLATNAHVIAKEQIPDLRVIFPSAPTSARGPLACVLVYEDSKRDLAILLVETGLRSLPVDDHYEFRRGQEVTVIGTPALESGGMFENAISRGVMSSKIEASGRKFYQLNVSINPGNSGGPVLNPRGRVIGVATATVRSREALALCIPSEDLERAVRAAEAQPARERPLVVAIHSAKSLLLDLDELGNAYHVLLGRYTKSLDEVVRRGQDLRSAHWEGRKLLDELLRPLENFVKTSVYARTTSVCADPLVPAQTRSDLGATWSNCMEMRKQLYSPFDDFRDRSSRIQALWLSHESKVKNLKNVLKLE
jgi:Flp pilus assembly protein CpaB